MNTSINFTHFRFAQPCFKNRQEMFKLLEYKFEDFNYYDHEDKYHLFNLMEIEINEAIWKTANLLNSTKGTTLKEYKELKLVLTHLKDIQSKQIVRCTIAAEWKPRNFGYFFHKDEYYAGRNFFSINFDAFEKKINDLEKQDEIYFDTANHKSLNDEFSVLEKKISTDVALYELKSKMGL